MVELYKIFLGSYGEKTFWHIRFIRHSYEKLSKFINHLEIISVHVKYNSP